MKSEGFCIVLPNFNIVVSEFAATSEATKFKSTVNYTTQE
jgi:hypothetical protein